MVQRTCVGIITVSPSIPTGTSGTSASRRQFSRSPQFTHVAFNDVRVVYDALTGGSRATSGRLVLYVMFTNPRLPGSA
jgi:hypothetical protein